MEYYLYYNNIYCASKCIYLDEFAEYFDYVRKLEFSETPDYENIKSLFYSAYEHNTLPDEKVFDWSAE